MFSWEELKTSTPTSLPLSLTWRSKKTICSSAKRFHSYRTRSELLKQKPFRYKLSFFYFQVQGEENTNTEIATFENLIDYISQDES